MRVSLFRSMDSRCLAEHESILASRDIRQSESLFSCKWISVNIDGRVWKNISSAWHHRQRSSVISRHQLSSSTTGRYPPCFLLVNIDVRLWSMPRRCSWIFTNKVSSILSRRFSPSIRFELFRSSGISECHWFEHLLSLRVEWMSECWLSTGDIHSDLSETFSSRCRYGMCGESLSVSSE